MYNDLFDENDQCDLVAIALSLKKYHCNWIIDGQACNGLVCGSDLTIHLKTAHQANDNPRLQCQWGGCGEILGKGCIVRHIQEKHFEWKWPCPRCGTTFSRRGVMGAHRANCGGAAAT